jgi:DNA (cytosine-5)-methyltransferase 1
LNKKPIALSFFSGAMGLDLGIEKAGFDIVLACENDKYCKETIEKNRPNTALLDDINQITIDEIFEVTQLARNNDIDLIMGGPPCQAFSTAGKRKGFNDGRGNVFLKFLSLALEIKPKFLVIENVRGLLSCPMLHRPHNQRGEGYPGLNLDELKGGALNFVLNRIEDAGYGYSFELYNSANFGTPQIRERVIIIASRDGQKPPYLVPTHSESGKDGYKKWRTFKQAVSRIKKHDHLSFPEKRLKYYSMLKSGQYWRNLPDDLQKEALGKSYYSGGGKTGFLRRLAWDRPAPTLVTHPAMPATDLCHPDENRPLSIQEYLRIQEFPYDWEIKGSLIQKYKQVGNAVPVGLGRAVGSHIISLINQKNVKNVNGFKYSRYKITNDEIWKEDFNNRVIKSKMTHEQLPILL